MKKIIMVHGWGGNNKDGWFGPLKKIFKKNKFEVISPNMPDAMSPVINNWVNYLRECSGEVDENTYFIGHSIGCQTILRFLESLDDNIQVGGAVLVAGWFNLTDKTWSKDYTYEIAKPWIESPINFSKIKKHIKKFLVILSDDDLYVPLSDSEIFKRELNAKVKIISNRGHIEELNEKEVQEILEFTKN